MSHIVSATLVTTEVEPGWGLTSDGVAVSKRYRIDLDSIGAGRIVNLETGQLKEIDIVFVVSPEPCGWIPLFALKVDDDA